MLIVNADENTSSTRYNCRIFIVLFYNLRCRTGTAFTVARLGLHFSTG